MRINVYAEELTDECELVTKTVMSEDLPKGERTFYGVRLFLKSPSELHKTDNDDDRSAITLWVPWTKADGHDFGALRAIIGELSVVLSQAVADNFNRTGKTGG